MRAVNARACASRVCVALLLLAACAAHGAARALWVEENAATAGRTGAWSSPVSYDAATGRARLVGEHAFTPRAASAGSYVTLKVTATLYRDGRDDAVDPGTQGGMRIGPDGGFQVWTGGPRFVAAPDGTKPVPPAWLDVSAAGVAPVSGAEYGVTFTFDYAHGRYSVSVRDATGGGWRSLQSAAGARTFPVARPDAYTLSSVVFSGETAFTSLEGSSSGRRE